MDFRFSRHAMEEMGNRNISMEVATQILLKPEQVVQDSSDMLVYQSILEENETKYLIRIFVAIDKTPNVVVTLYKTSKINKYWSYEG
ncbi:MAG: DUF4258 domain-containing protein [Bacteroidota bacterium]|nr:DUF4258 domain-containing protein [Bacteroidota bacterium]